MPWKGFDWEEDPAPVTPGAVQLLGEYATVTEEEAAWIMARVNELTPRLSGFSLFQLLRLHGKTWGRWRPPPLSPKQVKSLKHWDEYIARLEVPTPA